jgi:positive regulator of sigma E activity
MLAAGLLAAVAGVGDLAVATVAIGGLYLGFRLASRYSARLDRHDLKPHVVDIRRNPDNGRGTDINPRV